MARLRCFFLRDILWSATGFGPRDAWLRVEVSQMETTIPLSDAIGKYLDLASAQMKVTAQNMANVDTPGYKTQGFDFAQEFSRALDSSAGAEVSPRASDTDGLTARPDGNNVSLDREGVELAKAQLEFRTGVSLLRSEYTRMMDAIHADSK